MLSCYGFAVLAHSMIGAGHSHGEPQAAALVVALSDAPAGAADEASADALSLDEAGSEHAELVNARNDAPALLRFTEQPPKLGLTTTVSPFLARPKRPPRAAAFVA